MNSKMFVIVGSALAAIGAVSVLLSASNGSVAGAILAMIAGACGVLVIMGNVGKLVERRNTKPVGSAQERLDSALALIGYQDAQPSHRRYSVLCSIQMLAGQDDDDELMEAAESMMDAIRRENES